MPALGKRSEIGMKAEPMMPKPCSMPCICSTFTKASSVVIFIWGIPFPGPGGRAARARRICGARAGARALAYDAAVAGLKGQRSEEHTSELQSLMRISYAVFCLKKKIKYIKENKDHTKEATKNYNK